MCRYFKNGTVKQTVNKLFSNNRIIKITGAFSENDISLSGDFNGTLRQNWDLDNRDNVSFKDNFSVGKIPENYNIKYVYYGIGTANAVDSAIPNINNNYE